MSAEKVCRVCLSECNEWTPLWVQLPGENKTLEEAVNFVVNINIRLEDGLPDKICNICVSVLDLADTFKQRCLESESILEQRAREKQNDESQPKCEKRHQENSERYSASSESADNMYDLTKHKIKIEIEETTSEQENFDTTEYEVPIEHCYIKEEFSAEPIKYSENKETFSCPHCSLTFQTKLSYKVHILCIHSSFSHRKVVSNFKKPKLEVKLSTEDPAATDTSMAAITETHGDFGKPETTCVIKKKKQGKILNQKEKVITKISKNKTKKESIKDTATILKLSGTKTDDKITCAAEKQSECSNNTVIGTTGDIPTCDICGYTTATDKNLNIHLKAHAATKRYSCDSCLYITLRLSNFNNHVRTHTSDRSYACDKCNKKFSKKTNLDAHLRIHTNEKPYSCEMCDKKFIRKGDLVTHLKTHTGEKPYTCDVCGKNFSRKSYLVEHKRTHTGEKPYSCDVCDKKCARQSDLRAHIKTHTGKKPLMRYSCHVCERRFSKVFNLKRHVSIRHR